MSTVVQMINNSGHAIVVLDEPISRPVRSVTVWRSENDGGVYLQPDTSWGATPYPFPIDPNASPDPTTGIALGPQIVDHLDMTDYIRLTSEAGRVVYAGYWPDIPKSGQASAGLRFMETALADALTHPGAQPAAPKRSRISTPVVIWSVAAVAGLLLLAAVAERQSGSGLLCSVTGFGCGQTIASSRILNDGTTSPRQLQSRLSGQADAGQVQQDWCGLADSFATTLRSAQLTRDMRDHLSGQLREAETRCREMSVAPRQNAMGDRLARPSTLLPRPGDRPAGDGTTMPSTASLNDSRACVVRDPCRAATCFSNEQLNTGSPDVTRLLVEAQSLCASATQVASAPAPAAMAPPPIPAVSLPTPTSPQIVAGMYNARIPAACNAPNQYIAISVDASGKAQWSHDAAVDLTGKTRSVTWEGMLDGSGRLVGASPAVPGSSVSGLMTQDSRELQMRYPFCSDSVRLAVLNKRR